MCCSERNSPTALGKSLDQPYSSSSSYADSAQHLEVLQQTSYSMVQVPPFLFPFSQTLTSRSTSQRPHCCHLPLPTLSRPRSWTHNIEQQQPGGGPRQQSFPRSTQRCDKQKGRRIWQREAETAQCQAGWDTCFHEVWIWHRMVFQLPTFHDIWSGQVGDCEGHLELILVLHLQI